MWPDYLKIRTLAKRLDLEVGAVEQMVKRGLLPPPVKIGEAQLWRWQDVDAYLRAGRAESADDPIMRAIHAAQTPPSRQARA